MAITTIILLLASFMVLPSGKRRQTRTRSTRTKRSNTRSRRMKSALHGAEYRPQQDPPCITQQPYNNLVITTVLELPEESSAVAVTITSIGEALWKQLGASQNPNLTFKILRAAVWLTEGTYFNVSFSDLQRISDAPPFESTLEDAAAKNHFARVGFRWSAADSSVPYDTTSDPSANKTVLTILSPTKGTCLVHIQVLWRLRKISAPAVTQGSLIPLDLARASLHQNESPAIRQLCSILKSSLILCDYDTTQNSSGYTGIQPKD